MDEPDAAVTAASAAIDRACAELQARDPDAAARYQAQQDETARVLRETFGDVPAVVNVSWTELRPRVVTSEQRVAEARAKMWHEISAAPAPVQLRIDLNARTHDGRYVPARRDQASGPVKRGDNIIVYEPDDGVVTTATVMRCDDQWLHLDVDWDYMVDTSTGYDEANDHSYRDKVNAPLRPETIAALNARLAAGDMPTVVVPRRRAADGHPEP